MTRDPDRAMSWSEFQLCIHRPLKPGHGWFVTMPCMNEACSVPNHKVGPIQAQDENEVKRFLGALMITGRLACRPDSQVPDPRCKDDESSC